jgi:Zn-dependent protease with chaperone function
MMWRATLLDGASPVPRGATVAAETAALRITPDDATPLTWPIELVRVLNEPGAAVLRLSAGGDARLDVSDPAAITALAAHLDASPHRAAAGSRARRRVVGIVLALGAAIGGFVLGWPYAADALARATPLSWEATLGEAVDAKLFGQARRCDRPEGQAALDRLVARLAPHAGAPMPLSVVVLDQPQVNAAAMPGGRIVLFRGLLREAATADEVAGVIAHEMGHAAARHGMRGLYRGIGLSLLASAVTGGSTLADAGVYFATMAHSRDFERDADARAAAMLAGAGIGTQGLVDFFARMEKRDETHAGLLSYAASHPPSAERRAALPATTGTPALDFGSWQALRAICQ